MVLFFFFFKLERCSSGRERGVKRAFQLA